ncbi:MAG: hypothetical protein ABSH50_31340 [Bryobacteraceae bacterium]|jgi:hypothetical protein
MAEYFRLRIDVETQWIEELRKQYGIKAEYQAYLLLPASFGFNAKREMLREAAGRAVRSYMIKFDASQEKGFTIVDIEYDTTPVEGQAVVVQK